MIPLLRSKRITRSNGLHYSAQWTVSIFPMSLKKVPGCLRTRGEGATVRATRPSLYVKVDIFLHLAMGHQYLRYSEDNSDKQKVHSVILVTGEFPLEKITTFYSVGELERAFEEIKGEKP